MEPKETDIRENAQREAQQEATEARPKASRGGSLLKDLMSGSMITQKLVLRHLGFFILLTLLGILYIANRYHAEKVVREITALQKEVKELRSRSITISADLMFISKQSEVSRMVNERGLELKELREPPYKIIREE